MPHRPAAHLTPAQLQIMDLFWEHGELSVAALWKLLSARRSRPLARNTVQTTLSRLADKGWLKVRAQGNAFYYRPAAPRRRVLGRMLDALLHNAFAGSASGLVMALLESRELSPEEADRIRALIDKAEREET